MSSYNELPLREWTSDDIGRWLTDHHLRHLISRFEAAGVSGEELLTMEDNDMKVRLRMTNPGERAALNGALLSLKSNMKRTSHTMGAVVRPRSTSFEPGRGTHARTMPGRHMTSVSSISKPVEELKLGSAPELLDDHCRHSGWIRKVGGGYKHCEWYKLHKCMYKIIYTSTHTYYIYVYSKCMYIVCMCVWLHIGIIFRFSVYVCTIFYSVLLFH